MLFISIAILAVVSAALAKPEPLSLPYANVGRVICGGVEPAADVPEDSFTQLGWMLPTADGLAVGTDPTPIVFGAGLTPANDDLKAGNMYIDTTSDIKKRDNLYTFTVFKKGAATTMMVERPVIAGSTVSTFVQGANNTKNTEANTCYQFHVKLQKIIQGRHNQLVGFYTISADDYCLVCDLESGAISAAQCDGTQAQTWLIDAFTPVPTTDDAQEKVQVDQIEVQAGKEAEATDQAEGGAPKDTTAPAKKAPSSMESSDSEGIN
ncbi:hypothetical protein FB451DRAFT_1391762 [Mycena latifolia]|nr:hypothetical protein FB451DRAFT_1391762 [Mycena latifolia]